MKEFYIITEENREVTKQYMEIRERQIAADREYNAVTSNIHGVDRFRQFSKDRLDIILGFDRIRHIIPEELTIIRGKIEVNTKEANYSDELIDILTVVSKQGRFLVLKEPENGLEENEIKIFINILKEVEHTFEKIIISTENEDITYELGGIVDKYIRVVNKPRTVGINREEALKVLD